MMAIVQLEQFFASAAITPQPSPRAPFESTYVRALSTPL